MSSSSNKSDKSAVLLEALGSLEGQKGPSGVAASWGGLGKSNRWCPKAPGSPENTKKHCPRVVPTIWRGSALPGGFSQQRHGVQQPAAVLEEPEPCNTVSCRPHVGEDGFISGRRQSSSIVLAYPCYKTMLGTHPCLVMGLCNPPAAFVLKRDHGLPFVEQRCIATAGSSGRQTPASL